jgi:osmotically-inducible protein OsmY
LTWVGTQKSSREKTAAVAQKTLQNAYDWVRGVIAEGSSWLRQEEVPDAVLIARVKARLNRLASQPGAVDVGAEQGRVTLSGSVLDRERDPLLSSIASMRGVRDVVNHLDVQERTTTIMGVQDQPSH